MQHQTYGQHCGLVHALELVGEPWALLMIRDLLVEPKSLADMRRGLPQMPEEILNRRIEELERNRVIRRRDPVAQTGDSIFELTEYGAELQDIVPRFLLWGMRTLGGQRRDDVVTEDSVIMALSVTFRSVASRGIHVNYVLEMGNNIVVHVCVNDGHVEIGKGHLLNADLIIEAGPPLQLLLTGEMSPREALETNGIRLRSPDGGPGNPGLLTWFVELFHIPPAPIRTTADSLVPSLRAITPAPRVIAEHAVPAGTIH